MRVPRVIAALTVLVVAASSPAPVVAASASTGVAAEASVLLSGPGREGTYTNPVTEGVVDTFPDPVTIRGKDGAWYAYGTTNPIFQDLKGEDFEHYLPILRSEDLVTWEYVGDVFTPDTFPAWFGQDARLWAPDVRYIDGRYYLYYSVAGGGGGIGAVTAPTPAGPWTDSGGTVVPRGQTDCPTGDIDPAVYTDVDGTHYFYWGSYDVVCVARMNADATRIVEDGTEVLLGRRAEGAFVVRENGWYYMFYSEAGCCQGALSGYQVKVGRSKSPTGPFVDDRGTPLTAPEPKEGFVLTANGNRWRGPGHHGFFTDRAGQDWLIYHAIPEEDPDLEPVPGLARRLSRRPMLIDRLDWIDGWPTVRAGDGPSDQPQTAPVVEWLAGSEFNEGMAIPAGWRTAGAGARAWRLAEEEDAGGDLRNEARVPDPAFLISDAVEAADVRAEADLRLVAGSGVTEGGAGLVLDYRGEDNHIAVRLDAARHAVVTDVIVGGQSTGERVTPLPRQLDLTEWQHVAAERRGTSLHVEITGGAIGDPLAVQEREVPAVAVDGAPASVGAVSIGGAAEVDNLGVAPLYQPVTEGVADPDVGVLDPTFSDEFDDGVDPGSEPDSPWRWVRDAEGSEQDGVFSWTTNGEELFETENTASVLLRDAPEGEFTIETKLSFDPTEPSSQAGLIVYANDDDYTKLVSVPLNLNPRFGGPVGHYTEFGLETARPTIEVDAFHGPMYVGPPAETMWMRLHHVYDAEEGEHDIRAATSTDGQRWVWGGTWSLPGDLNIDVGLVTLNRPGVTAEFEYFRTYQP